VLGPLGKRKQELRLADKLGENSDVKAVEKGRKSNENKRKRDKASRQVYLPASVVEKTVRYRMK
jgi:hypothetical protein